MSIQGVTQWLGAKSGVALLGCPVEVQVLEDTNTDLSETQSNRESVDLLKVKTALH